MELPVNPSAMIDLLRAWFFAKDRSIVMADDTFIEGAEISTPDNPIAGRGRLYYDGSCWVQLNEDGTVTQLCGGGFGIGGRLTLTSATPVTTSDVSGASTLYFTPDFASQFTGQVSLYDGSNWKSFSFTELSLVLAGLTNGKNYDVFLYDNSGTLTLELSSAWTNDTTRNDALALQDGIYVKSGTTTRRYIGTIRTTSTTTTEDSQSKRFVWNLFNQVQKSLLFTDVTASWTYTTNTWRPWNNSTSNRVEAVMGLNIGMVYLDFVGGSSQNGNNDYRAVGIGLDRTNANDADIVSITNERTDVIVHNAIFNNYIGLGYHYLQGLERAVASGTVTWIGVNPNLGGTTKFGATGRILC